MKRRGAERVFLELLAKTAEEGRAVSSSPNGVNFAPRLFARRRDREGLKRRDFERAMEALFADGRIRLETFGKPSDNRRRLVATGEEDDDLLL